MSATATLAAKYTDLFSLVNKVYFGEETTPFETFILR